MPIEDSITFSLLCCPPVYLLSSICHQGVSDCGGDSIPGNCCR